MWFCYCNCAKRPASPRPGLARTQGRVKPLVYEKMHRFFSRDFAKIFGLGGAERP